MTFAVGFDFDRTLGRDHGLEINAFYLLARELGVQLDPHDESRRAHIEELLGDFRTEKITLAQAVAEFARTIGARDPGPQGDERYRELCYSLVPNVTAVDGARALLDRLRDEGVRVAILTNGWSPLQQKKIEQSLGFRGPVLVSDQLGVAKPERLAFDRLAEVLAMPNGQCWYVGDNARADACGAMEAGMHAVWFDTGENAYPPDLPSPTATIRSLAELDAVLPGPAVATENPRH